MHIGQLRRVQGTVVVKREGRRLRVVHGILCRCHGQRRRKSPLRLGMHSRATRTLPGQLVLADTSVRQRAPEQQLSLIHI